MKKILLTLACVFGMSTVASALTSSAVLLQHNGNITTYAAEDIAQAMAAAADGDEVFLNEGKYPGFTISSAIKIKGAGQRTIILGDVIIDNSSDISIGDIFLGFLCLDSGTKLYCKSSINKLNLLQCFFPIVVFSEYINADNDGFVEEVFVDRCEVGSLINLSSYYTKEFTLEGKTTIYTFPRVKKFTAMNSNLKFRQQTNFTTYPPYTFINCYVVFGDSRGDGKGLTLINSIVSRSNYVMDSEFVNCVYSGRDESSNATDCYVSSSISTSWISSSWTTEQLEEDGYLGNDGTVVGPLGGARNTPFTLVPTVPRVTESNLMVDPQKKELNVTVTVTPK